MTVMREGKGAASQQSQGKKRKNFGKEHCKKRWEIDKKTKGSY